MPGKRGNAANKATKKEAPAPAKKAPAKAKAVGSSGTFAEKMAALTAGSPSGTAQIVDIEAIDDLWSIPRHWIPTGSIAIDAAIGGPQPGLPTGRLTEVFGPENIGKTTFLAALITQCQRMGGMPILTDTEHKIDLHRLRDLGVDLKRLQFEQVSAIEDVFDVLKYWLVKGREMMGPDVPMLFAWDSVAGTPSRAEFKADTDQKFQAEAAKILKQQFRSCAQLIAQNQAAVVVTNQVYAKMGGSWGPTDETYGGGAIKYHSTIRISLRFAGQLKPPGATAEDKVPPVGQLVEARIIKNQIAAPWRFRRYAIRYDVGIDDTWSIFTELKEKGYIVTSGSWLQISKQLQEHLGIETKSFQGGHFGLTALCTEYPQLYALMRDIYMGKVSL